MRFLFGIFVGAGLTLLVATAIDAPTNPIVEQAATGWQRLIELTSRALFPARTPAGDASAAVPPMRLAKAERTEPAPADTTVPPQAVADDDTVSGDSEEDPAPPARSEAALPTESQLALPADTDAALPAESDVTPPVASDVATLVAAADRELAGLGHPEQVETPAADQPADSGPDPLANDDLAGVWSPFHSERSAKGFARRLSDQFQHPFSVERVGPGAYQVVFSYSDPTERDALLAEIAEVTGP